MKPADEERGGNPLAETRRARPNSGRASAGAMSGATRWHGAGPRPRNTIRFALPRPRRCCTTPICCAGVFCRRPKRPCATFHAFLRTRVLAAEGRAMGSPLRASGLCERLRAGLARAADDAAKAHGGHQPMKRDAKRTDWLVTDMRAERQPHLVSASTARESRAPSVGCSLIGLREAAERCAIAHEMWAVMTQVSAGEGSVTGQGPTSEARRESPGREHVWSWRDGCSRDRRSAGKSEGPRLPCGCDRGPKRWCRAIPRGVQLGRTSRGGSHHGHFGL